MSTKLALNAQAKADAFKFGILRMGSAGMQHVRAIAHGQNMLASYTARKPGILGGDLSSLEFNWMPGVPGPVLDVEGIVTSQEIGSALKADCAGVIVCSPTTMHYQDARAVMMAGKHCLIEKPATSTSAEARNLIQLSSERGVKLGVAQVLSAIPEFGYLRDMILSGKELKRLEMRRWVPWSRVLDLNDMEARGGFLTDLGIHEAHFLASLEAVLKITNGKVTQLWHHENLAQRAHFRLYAGDCEIICDVGASSLCEVAFTHGFEAKFVDGDKLVLGTDGFLLNGEPVTNCPVRSPIEVFAYEQQIFADWCRGTRPDGAFLSPEMALKALEVIETIRQLQNGQEFRW